MSPSAAARLCRGEPDRERRLGRRIYFFDSGGLIIILISKNSLINNILDILKIFFPEKRYKVVINHFGVKIKRDHH